MVSTALRPPSDREQAQSDARTPAPQSDPSTLTPVPTLYLEVIPPAMMIPTIPGIRPHLLPNAGGYIQTPKRILRAHPRRQWRQRGIRFVAVHVLIFLVPVQLLPSLFLGV